MKKFYHLTVKDNQDNVVHFCKERSPYTATVEAAALRRTYRDCNLTIEYVTEQVDN